MKATLTTLAAAAVVALGTTVAEARQAAGEQKQPPPAEVILTGCIVQGSSPTVFLFENAKKDPASQAEKGVKYLLVATAEDVDLRTHLNHEVRVVGEIDAKVVSLPVIPPEKAPAESGLPRLNAKSVTMVSNTCSLAR